MKYSCDVIQDLLPLYYDKVSSRDSQKAVEEHLSECASCRDLLKKMHNSTNEDRLSKERDEVILNHTRETRKSICQVLFGLISLLLLICLIVNLATTHTLDWFFIVLTSTMTAASLLAVPLIVPEKKLLRTLEAFVISILLLLLTCCLYSGGKWFWAASSAVLFGLSIVVLPFVVGSLPLKGFAADNKGTVVMAADTLLFYVLIVACGFYGASAAYWRPALLISTEAVLFAWLIFLVIRYLKANGWIRSGICMIVSGLFLSLIHDLINWSMDGTTHISFLDANLRNWSTDALMNANSYLLILIICSITGAVLLLTGWIRRGKKAAE